MALDYWAYLIIISVIGCILLGLYLGSSSEPLEDTPMSDYERAWIETIVFMQPLKLPKTNTPQERGDEKLGLLFLDLEAAEPWTGESSDTSGEKLDLLSDNPEDSFHDAQPIASPLIPHIQIHPDPDFLPLPTLPSGPPTPYSTPPSTPPRTLRRIPSHLSMASPTKPAWSLRAAASPSLGLTGASPSKRAVCLEPVSIPIPGAFVAAETDAPPAAVERAAPRRAYRAPMPELDLAFALQLRPSFGAGADAAWCVRFLVVMLGWMTMWVGGGREGRRAITAV